MYIRALHVQNFRKFRDLWFVPNRGANVLVGPNNAGKSTVLRAISLCLDPSIRHGWDRPLTRADFNALDTAIELRCWLGFDGYETEPQKLGLGNKRTQWTVDESVQTVTPMTIKPMAVVAPEKGAEELLCIAVTGRWIAGEGEAETEICVLDETEEKRWAVGRKERELIGFHRVPAGGDASEELSLARRSVLGRRVEDGEVTAGLRGLVKGAGPHLDHMASSGSLLKALDDLSRIVRTETPVDVGEEARLSLMLEERGEAALRRAVTLGVGRADATPGTARRLPLSSEGDGLRRALLLLYVAEGLELKGSSPIVVAEEPEQNLDPPLARWVFEQLCMSGVGRPGAPPDGSTRRGQVFLTTHSPVLAADAARRENLVVFGRDLRQRDVPAEKGDGTGAPPGEPDCASGLSATPIVWSRQEAQVKKTLAGVAAESASGLYARQVLIVDGDTEVGLLPVLFRASASNEEGMARCLFGLEVVNAHGTKNIPGVCRAFKALGITTHVLLDYDPCDPQEESTTQDILRAAAFVTSWPRSEPPEFAKGWALETALVARGDIKTLFLAVREVYAECGHHLKDSAWQSERDKLGSAELKCAMPQEFPDLAQWNADDICSLAQEAGKCPDKLVDGKRCDDRKCQRAFLYAALHGPNSWKSVRDGRILGDALVRENGVPDIFKELLQRVADTMQPDCQEDWGELGGHDA